MPKELQRGEPLSTLLAGADHPREADIVRRQVDKRYEMKKMQGPLPLAVLLTWFLSRNFMHNTIKGRHIIF